VRKAQPQFPGHEQPHVPTELGYYDLRHAQVRAAQADLARAHGIHGFCYYHYWFGGRRVLEGPFEEVLRSGAPDFPFCLCWANENWTRRWDGLEREVLLAQQYSPADDAAHFRALLPAFRDPRYIRVNGRPLFLVYRISRLPDPSATLARWRSLAREAGLPGLYVCNVESFPEEHSLAPRVGLDAAVEFGPDWGALPRPIARGRRGALLWWLRRMRPRPEGYLRHHVARYEDLARNMMRKPAPDYVRFPGLTPMWDNTARRRTDAVILQGSSPAAYEAWLRFCAERAAALPPEERFVFINAWNEWAEGNHLEPCERWGRRYLEATRRVIGGAC